MKQALLLFFLFSLNACTIIDSQDTRNSKAEWNDTQLVIEVAGIVNKPPYKGESRINAASYEGYLLLVGQISSESLKKSLLEKIKQIKNVSQVYDQIQIKAPLSLSQVSKDTWLTAKVKSAFIASKKLRSTNIKVITEDSEVFLLGYLTKEQAQVATEIARNIQGVKQVIKGFHYIDAAQ